ncbi:MAG: glutamine synthetase beta-grasp domain-containing protein, partial [Alphaproteobacteria bacterium]|nr:glutamine synthetase beta-grasp domain-containing protein [Alphaproteobacteria bacterium]
MTEVSDILKLIKDNDVKYVDLRFTDPRGKWQHVAMDAEVVDEEMFAEGVMFDGSSIAGWKAINESDMTLKPDLESAVMDPFSAQSQLILVCDILEPSTGEPYGRDPRTTAKKALEYMNFAGIGDTAFFGPEPEFFVFDDVRFEVSYNRAFFEFDDVEGPYNAGAEMET